jgi:CheY-like chemotaxis protein
VDGWSILDRLKKNPRTRHIPVNVITVTEKNDRERGQAVHAFAFLEKPVSRESLDTAFQHIHAFLDRKVKRLLLVEDNDIERKTLTELVGEGDDVDVTSVPSGAEAIGELEKHPFDCAVVDLGLPDMDGFNLIEHIKTKSAFGDLPIIVYTSRELSRKEEQRLRKYAETVIRKTSAKSPEKLLDETALFLHRADDNLPQRTRDLVNTVREPEPALEGRKVLVVDDDVRNIFALTSVLESHGMNVVYAESGRAGIEMLEKQGDVDLVLMDIMMPDMDGYETMRRIRKDGRWGDLPIIAVTAKALKDDREKCVAAGATDYLPKPVEPAKLMQLIRMWLVK